MIWEKRRHLHQVVCHPGQRTAYWGLGDTPLSSFSSNSNSLHYHTTPLHSLVKIKALDLVTYIPGKYHQRKQDAIDQIPTNLCFKHLIRGVCCDQNNLVTI